MRTKFDANEIILYEDYAEIVLYDKNNKEKARTKIDLSMVSCVSGVKWYRRPDGYVATNNYKGNGYVYFHSIIIEKTNNKTYVDHINGDRLDNRRNNLRIVTPTQNGMNKHISSKNTSGRTGVHWAK